MTRCGFRGEDGDERLIEALARGWGLAIYCRACDRHRTVTAPSLLNRFPSRLDDRASEIMGRIVCGECRGSVRLGWVQTEPALSAATYPQAAEIDRIDDMRRRLREHVANHFPATPSSYALAQKR